MTRKRSGLEAEERNTMPGKPPSEVQKTQKKHLGQNKTNACHFSFIAVGAMSRLNDFVNDLEETLLATSILRYSDADCAGREYTEIIRGRSIIKIEGCSIMSFRRMQQTHTMRRCANVNSTH